MEFWILQSVSSSAGEYHKILNKDEESWSFDAIDSPASWGRTSTVTGMVKLGTDG